MSCGLAFLFLLVASSLAGPVGDSPQPDTFLGSFPLSFIEKSQEIYQQAKTRVTEFVHEFKDVPQQLKDSIEVLKNRFSVSCKRLLCIANSKSENGKNSVPYNEEEQTVLPVLLPILPKSADQEIKDMQFVIGRTEVPLYSEDSESEDSGKEIDEDIKDMLKNKNEILNEIDRKVSETTVDDDIPDDDVTYKNESLRHEVSDLMDMDIRNDPILKIDLTHDVAEVPEIIDDDVQNMQTYTNESLYETEDEVFTIKGGKNFEDTQVLDETFHEDPKSIDEDVQDTKLVNSGESALKVAQNNITGDVWKKVRMTRFVRESLRAGEIPDFYEVFPKSKSELCKLWSETEPMRQCRPEFRCTNECNQNIFESGRIRSCAHCCFGRNETYSKMRENVCDLIQITKIIRKDKNVPDYAEDVLFDTVRLVEADDRFQPLDLYRLIRNHAFKVLMRYFDCKYLCDSPERQLEPDREEYEESKAQESEEELPMVSMMQ